jgi:predicted nuclease of predicted toxin-antitoxin system
LKFLVDRCAGQRLATWLEVSGHDVHTAREREPDPGGVALLRMAAEDGGFVVTIDSDFVRHMPVSSACPMSRPPRDRPYG